MFFPISLAAAGSATKNPEKEKKEEGAQPKPQKFNPFGAAKPRDENQYVKKKKEESKEDVFEEIKELKGSQLEKAQPQPKVEEKPKVIVEKKEEEFIVAG